MKEFGRFWLKQAGIGLVFVLVIAVLGHFNYAKGQLIGGITGADWYFLLSWICFPFAKWVVLMDDRDLQAPIFRRRRRRRRQAADETASVYEKMAKPERAPRLEAAPKSKQAWYWRLLIDIALAFMAPIILGGFVTYSLKHN